MTAEVSRPAPIAFDDLAEPVYPETARPMRDGLAAYGATVALTPEALQATAAGRAGLTDFGDDGFRERLQVLCDALNSEAGLSDAGRALAFEQLTQHLVNRLRLHDLLTRHPEILTIPVERPIVICGLPRTGTTHLHNMIAADPAIRHLPYWESLEPVPAPGRRIRRHAANGVPPDWIWSTR